MPYKSNAQRKAVMVKIVNTGYNKKCYKGCRRNITFVSSSGTPDNSLYGYCGYHSKNKLDDTRLPLKEIGRYKLVDN
jgi:hypothetical protein